MRTPFSNPALDTRLLAWLTGCTEDGLEDRTEDGIENGMEDGIEADQPPT